MKCFAIVILILCFTLIGCSTQRIDLERSGYLRVKESSPSNTWLLTSVYEVDESLVVTGTISQGTLSNLHLPGHIDIRVVNEVGEEIYLVKASLHRVPVARRRVHPMAFSVTFPAMPPKGSMVEVVYDRETHL